MALPRLTPKAYHRITLVALILLGVIVVSGAAVRLTGSGLGCSDWPTCQANRLVAPLQLHPMVEFVNRVFTGLVSIIVIVAVLGSVLRQPRRADLVWLSAGLVAGVIGQIVLGGITVLTDLNPLAVQGHFVLSMAIVLDAAVLHQRAGEAPGPYRPTVAPALRRASLALVALAAAVLVTGTVVTGTGPHGGDERAHRFPFDITDVARVHGITVMVLLATTLWVVYRARRLGAWAVLDARLTLLVWLIVVQGAIGYTQYFAGVPSLLVLCHVIGAVSVWYGTLLLMFATRAPGLSGSAPTRATASPAWPPRRRTRPSSPARSGRPA